MTRARFGARGTAAACACALLSVWAGAAAAQSTLTSEARRQADAALSLLSVSISPNRSANALYLDNRGGRPFELTALQAGVGRTLAGERPIYLEGYVAASLYDPSLVLGPGAAGGPRWRNVSATVGVGWTFALDEHLSARPILNVALGSVSADAGGLLPRPGSLPLPGSDDVLVGGLGASGVLEYRRSFGEVEASSELRLTLMRLEGMGKVFGVSASADAASLATWNRVWVPTGREVLGRPLRAVGELSASWLPGDQGVALRTRWLAQVGGGLEVDFTAYERPWVQRARVMVRAVTGEQLVGVSVGVGLTF